MIQKIKSTLAHPVFKNNILFSGGSYFFRLFNTLIIFSLLARIYTVPNFGMISFFLGVMKIVQTGIDYGHRIAVVRDLANDRSLISQGYLSSKFWVKVLMLGVFALGTLSYAYYHEFWGYNPLIVIALIGAAFTSGVTNFYYAILQGFDKFKYETYSTAVLSILSLGIIGIALLRPSVAMFIAGYFVAVTIQMVITHMMTKKAIPGFSLSSLIGRFDIPEISRELKVGFTFASIVILEIVFSSYDTLFVESNYTDLDLGYFEGFKKIYIGLTIVSIILGAALFPTLSRLARNVTIVNIKKILFINFGMIAIGVIVFLIYFPLNEIVIRIILGNNFGALTTWDFHIALITIAAYVRIIPGLYFVSASKEKVRLWLTMMFLLIEVYLFYQLSGSHDVRHAIKLTTNINVWLTVAFSAFFGWFLFSQYLELKKAEPKTEY